MFIKRMIAVILLYLFPVMLLANTVPTSVAPNKVQIATKVAPVAPAKTVITPTTAKVADDPTADIVPLQLDNNDLYRSHDDTQDVTYVDPYTGRVHLHIPLIHIPGNDGLDLKVNLNWNGMQRPYENPLGQDPILPGTDEPTGKGSNNPSIFTGIVPIWPLGYATGSIADNFPAFIDPDGHVHVLYPQTATWTQVNTSSTFQTKDQWSASLTLVAVDPSQCIPIPSIGSGVTFSGTITAPNGVQYQVEPRCRLSPVVKITSPHSGTILTYTNNSLGQVTSITSNQGFNVNFTYNTGVYPDNQDLASIKTSDDRNWTFSYESQQVPGYYSKYSLSSVTLPNGTNWSMHFAMENTYLYDQGDFTLVSITAPKGLAIVYSYATDHCSVWSVCALADRLAYAYVASRTVSAPGIPTATWNYSYELMTGSQTNFQYGSHTTITGPNKKIVYTYNVENDLLQNPGYPIPLQPMPTPKTGLLLSEAIYDPTGTTLYEQDDYTWEQRQISPIGMYSSSSWCVPAGANVSGPYDPSTGMFAPELMTKTITRSGAVYSTKYSNYDSYGYPGQIFERSPQDMLSRNLTYYENPTLWIFKPASEVTMYKGAEDNNIARSFDTKGNMIAENSNGINTSYAYDAKGNVINVTDAAGHVTTYSDYMSGLPQKTVDAMGHTSSMVVANNGTITSKTDKIGYVTSYTYDPLYRLASITPPVHAPAIITWNDSPTGSSVEIVRGQHKIINNYTGYGDILSSNESGGTYTRNVFRSYDPDRRLTFVSYPVAGSAPGAGIATTYDSLDRVLSATEAGKYTATNRYVDATNSIIKTDPNNNVTTLQYRSFGDPDDKQLMSIQQQADGMPITITFQRNSLGQIMLITQGKLRRQYVYNDHHYLTDEYNPETGRTIYGRDILGNMINKRININNTVVGYHYDALSRLITTDYQNTSGVYVTASRLYDANDRLLAAGDSYSNTVWYYRYDANGNNISAVLNYDLPSKSGSGKNDFNYNFTYTYDDLDHLSSMTYPTGTALTYNIDPMGNVLSIAPYITNINYFPDGKVQSFADGNGVTTSYTENDRNMIDSVLIAKGATQLENRKYTFDGDNNILSIQDVLDATNNQSFGYNSVNWLTSGTGPWGKAAISYDVNGNILSKTSDSEQLRYSYDSQTNLLTTIAGTSNYNFAYDLAGDVSAMGNSTYSYDALKRLAQINGTNPSGQSFKANYYYDGNGNRVFTNSTLITNNVLEAYSRSSQLLYKYNATQHELYIYLGDHVIAHTIIAADNAAKTTYLHNSLLGSPLAASDESGNNLWQQEYKPYGGELKDNKAQDASHIGYTGKPHDKNTGLSYYGARYYNPQIGRFMSMDSRQVVDVMPLTFNKYVYAANNPYKYKDPDGNFIVEVAVGGALGFVGGLETGGWVGAFAGGFAGAAVGFFDPFASEAVGAYVGEVAGSIAGLAARAGTSVAINTAANAAQSQYMTGSYNWGQSFSAGLGGVASGNITGLGMSRLGNYAGSRVGNALASGAMAQAGSHAGASSYNSATSSSSAGDSSSYSSSWSSGDCHGATEVSNAPTVHNFSYKTCNNPTTFNVDGMGDIADPDSGGNTGGHDDGGNSGGDDDSGGSGSSGDDQ